MIRPPPFYVDSYKVEVLSWTLPNLYLSLFLLLGCVLVLSFTMKYCISYIQIVHTCILSFLFFFQLDTQRLILKQNAETKK